MHQVTAKPRSIQGPEVMSNGGSKFYVSLDNGTTVVTFSKVAQRELMKNLDQDVEFVLDAPLAPNTTPRIEKATLVVGGAVLYDRAASAARAPGATPQAVPQATGGGGGNFYQDETTRAVEFAFGYLSAWNAAVVASGGSFMSMDLFVAKLSDLANIAHEQILELRKPHPATAALKEAAEEKLASVPEGWQ